MTLQFTLSCSLLIKLAHVGKNRTGAVTPTRSVLADGLSGTQKRQDSWQEASGIKRFLVRTVRHISFFPSNHWSITLSTELAQPREMYYVFFLQSILLYCSSSSGLWQLEKDQNLVQSSSTGGVGQILRTKFGQLCQNVSKKSTNKTPKNHFSLWRFDLPPHPGAVHLCNRIREDSWASSSSSSFFGVVSCQSPSGLGPKRGVKNLVSSSSLGGMDNFGRPKFGPEQPKKTTFSKESPVRHVCKRVVRGPNLAPLHSSMARGWALAAPPLKLNTHRI